MSVCPVLRVLICGVGFELRTNREVGMDIAQLVLAILDLLGIRNILIALTKIDRVAPGDLLEVSKQVNNFLNEQGHRNHELYPVCAPKGIGIEPLKEELTFRARSQKPKVVCGYFRMAIDRAFNLKGVIGLLRASIDWSSKAFAFVLNSTIQYFLVWIFK